MIELNRDKLGRILKLNLNDKEIIRLYQEEKKSSPKIAKRFNVCRDTIINILKRNKIPIYPLGFFMRDENISDITREKLRNQNLGRKLSLEHREKVIKNLHGTFRKNKTYEEIYGKEKADEWKNKQSLAQLREKNPNFGGTLTEEHIEKIRNYMLSHKRTKKHCENISKSKIGEMNGMFGKTGELNHQWRGGISFEPYDKLFNSKFKKVIKGRDGCCILCNISFEDLKLLKKVVAIHHINYDKLMSIPQNCISLCNSCHSRTNSNRKHWTDFFQSLLSERYGYVYEENKIILELKK